MGADFGIFQRRAVRALAFAVATLLAPIAPDTAAARPSGHIVVDSKSGVILDQKNATTLMHPASLTKMMTLYLAFEAIEARTHSAGEMLRVSRHAASMPPSELGLRRGDRISLRDAIRGAAVKSANDAAVVIAEAISGDEASFAKLMTAKARELDMKDTTFRNASGLTKNGHLSTPRDMVILARRLYLDFNDYYWMFSKRSMRIRGQRYNATNSLLGVAAGVDGVKTGYTRAAGYNLASSALRDGERVFVIRMGASSRSRRDRDVTRLLTRGFARVTKLREREREKERDNRRQKNALVAALSAAPASRPRPSPESDRPAIEQTAAIETASIRVGATALLESATASAEEETPASVRVDWRIQVGAFGSEDAAHKLLDTLAIRFSAELESAMHAVEPVVKPGDEKPSMFRARFSELSHEGAEAACTALKAAGEACTPVPPAGWTQVAAN